MAYLAGAASPDTQPPHQWLWPQLHPRLPDKCRCALVGVGGITVEAIHRLIDGVPAGEVDGKTEMIVAAVGILVNGVTALLFA